MNAHVYRPREIPGSILRQLYGLNLGIGGGTMRGDLTYVLQYCPTEQCISVVVDETRVVSWALFDATWGYGPGWIHVYTRRSERGQGYARTALAPLIKLAPHAKHVYSRRKFAPAKLSGTRRSYR